MCCPRHTATTASAELQGQARHWEADGRLSSDLKQPDRRVRGATGGGDNLTCVGVLMRCKSGRAGAEARGSGARVRQVKPILARRDPRLLDRHRPKPPMGNERCLAGLNLPQQTGNNICIVAEVSAKLL
jgi:hypothetical protein